MKLTMRLLYLTALLTAFCLIDTASWANGSIPVTGTGSFSSANSYSFNFAGSRAGNSVSAFSTTPDARESLSCLEGVVCTINLPTFQICDFDDSLGTLNNVTVNHLFGGSQFTFIAPVVPDGNFSNLTAPATFSGSVEGVNKIPSVCTYYGPGWVVDVTGKGTASLAGFAEGGTLNLIEASMNFDGTATSPNFTPEPSSFVLIGSGVLGLAGVLRRKLMP